MLSFDMEEISAILNDINLITKVKFDLYDKDFKILTRRFYLWKKSQVLQLII